MNRSRKTKLLQQLFTGEPALLRNHKAALDSQRKTLTQADYEAMTDQELVAIIEAYTGQPCPDYEAMTDQQLTAIIAKGHP